MVDGRGMIGTVISEGVWLLVMIRFWENHKSVDGWSGVKGTSSQLNRKNLQEQRIVEISK